MAISIVEKYVDLAGYYRVRVSNGTRTADFKFNHDPTNAEIQTAIDNFIATQQALQDAREADKADRLDLLDYVQMYYDNPNSLTNNQKSTLLTRLCNRIVNRSINLE